MEEKIETPAEQPAPVQEAVPDWNTPKPIEDELKKYSGGKGLKIFIVIGLVVILAAAALFVYKLVIGGMKPAEQFQRQPATTEKTTTTEETTTKETTVEEDIQEIENINIDELDDVIDPNLDDLNL